MRFTETQRWQNAQRDRWDSGEITRDEYLTERERINGAEQAMRDALNFLRDNDHQSLMPALFLHALTSEHRTHQQSIIRNLHEALKRYGQCDSDLRNAEAVKWAREATTGESSFPFI